jgi:hypothetical protein
VSSSLPSPACEAEHGFPCLSYFSLLYTVLLKISLAKLPKINKQKKNQEKKKRKTIKETPTI